MFILDIKLKQKKEFTDKESLLAMVSHDLKNPVNSGILAVKLLQSAAESPLNKFQKELLNSVLYGFLYMQNLIENVLDRYKFVNDVYTIKKNPFDFASLVKITIDEARYIFSEKEQKVKFLNEIKNPMAEFDLLEITRAINNLISNASIYSPSKSEIIIKIFEDKDNVGLSIENAGCSFDFDNPNEIFEKFVSKGTKSKSIASGLGLYITKKIIDAHGGNIFVESQINKFTRFTFKIPRK